VERADVLGLVKGQKRSDISTARENTNKKEEAVSESLGWVLIKGTIRRRP